MDAEDNSFRRSEAGSAGRALHADALTARLLAIATPGNARRSGECCSIRLWNEFAQMLHGAPKLGEVLVVTGNEGAILGERREYPALTFSENFLRAQAVDGSLDIEFVPWGGGAVVCHHHGGSGASQTIEFRDCTNAVIHKVCLTGSSLPDRFVEWVEHHQAIGEFTNAAPAPAFAPSRWQTVQQRHWLDYDEVVELPGQALEGILQYACEQEATLRVVVGNEGIVQSSELTPRSVRARGSWLFTSDDTVGLHFDPDRLSTQVLHGPAARNGRHASLQFKSFSEDGALRLALAAPAGMAEDEWADFLNTAIDHL
ncbi:MAG TPA: hypothetical protein VIM61_04385 [Chthoniobacterales bacterium]